MKTQTFCLNCNQEVNPGNELIISIGNAKTNFKDFRVFHEKCFEVFSGETLVDAGPPTFYDPIPNYLCVFVGSHTAYESHDKNITISMKRIDITPEIVEQIKDTILEDLL